MWWLLAQSWPAVLRRPYRRVTTGLALWAGVAVWAIPEPAADKLIVLGSCGLASVASALAALAAGARWRMNVVPGEQRGDPDRLPVVLLRAAIVAYLLALPAVIVARPGCWPASIPAWLLGGWFALWSWLVAGMAVSGDWL